MTRVGPAAAKGLPMAGDPDWRGVGTKAKGLASGPGKVLWLLKMVSIAWGTCASILAACGPSLTLKTCHWGQAVQLCKLLTRARLGVVMNRVSRILLLGGILQSSVLSLIIWVMWAKSLHLCVPQFVHL